MKRKLDNGDIAYYSQVLDKTYPNPLIFNIKELIGTTHYPRTGIELMYKQWCFTCCLIYNITVKEDKLLANLFNICDDSIEFKKKMCQTLFEYVSENYLKIPEVIKMLNIINDHLSIIFGKEIEVYHAQCIGSISTGSVIRSNFTHIRFPHDPDLNNVRFLKIIVLSDLLNIAALLQLDKCLICSKTLTNSKTYGISACIYCERRLYLNKDDITTLPNDNCAFIRITELKKFYHIMNKQELIDNKGIRKHIDHGVPYFLLSDIKKFYTSTRT